MDNYFENILMNATDICIGNIGYQNRFDRIYPFTTENISGYISMFKLAGKSLLTVGSSGDQVINASMFNCKNQTVVDINPYTKFYFYLKKAALLTLDYNSFLSFFCYKDFPKFCKNNNDVFNLKMYKRIKPLLRLLDYESYLFWDEMFLSFPTTLIRQKLFEYDEDKLSVLKHTNIYMKDEYNYEQAKHHIKNVNPSFIIGDIFNVELNDMYDNIFMSNLLQYYPIDKVKTLVDKLSINLANGGSLLISYLYKTTIATKYCDNWAEIYDLDRVFNLLKEYDISLNSFIGTHGILFEDPKDQDAVLIYKKR